MFIGNVEPNNIDGFILDNEETIRKMLDDVIKYLPQDDYPNADEYKVAVCSIVSNAILEGFTDVTDPDIGNTNSELIYELVHALFIRKVIWDFEKNKLCVENPDGTFTFSDQAVQILHEIGENIRSA